MIVATLRLRFRADVVDEGMRHLEELLVETRGFSGCQGVEVAVDVDDPAGVLVIERWATLEDDLAYLAWRAGPGRVDLARWLDGPTTLTRYTPRADL